jgi:hypothetical protein
MPKEESLELPIRKPTDNNDGAMPMTALIIDTGALQRFAESGSLDLLFKNGNTVVITTTVEAELQIGSALE